MGTQLYYLHIFCYNHYYSNVTSFIKSINWPNQITNLTDNFKPDVVVINAGANDIYSVSNNNIDSSGNM